MANKPINMTKIKRIIQLLKAGEKKSVISRSVGINRITLDRYLTKIELTGKSFDELLSLTDVDISNLIYQVSHTNQPDDRYLNLKEQFDYFNQELKKTGVTRKLLWEEYNEAYPEGYSYTQFCEHFARFRQAKDATMILSHNPGEYLQADFAGTQLEYIDRFTGEIIKCPVLVCVLPFSGRTYVEALSSAKQEPLFNALSRCLSYMGGVPRNIKSDNMRQYMVKNERYEYAFTELAEQWGVHYNTNLTATRPYKPKDKPTVENGVRMSYLRIYAKLRNEEFYSLEELNKRILELLNIHNNTPFQKLQLTRQMRFEQEEKECLVSLPAAPFIIKHKTKGKVQKNYHVVLGEDKYQYSVPYKYIGQQTHLIYDEKTVEIFIGLERIACHKRSHSSSGHSTIADHMPESHKKYSETLGWNADYFLSFAKTIGPNAKDVFTRMLASRDFIEQSYTACIGLIRLSEKYGNDRFEAACKRAANASRINFRLIKNILKNNLDRQESNYLNLFTTPKHDNIRGADAYNF